MGSVSDVSSSAGASLTWGEYYPYGLVRTAGVGAGAPAVQPFGFTGEQLDTIAGLYHLRARQYDPATGRFLSTDPAAPTIVDPYVGTYVYVSDNPTRLIDPSGRCPWCITGLIGAVAGALTYGVGVVGSNFFQGKDLTAGLNVQDALISAGSGFVVGATGGLSLVARVPIGFATGAGSSVASQTLNGRPFDPGEIFLGAGFGALGGAVDFGSGLVGFFRGLVGGGGLNAIQNWLFENRPPGSPQPQIGMGGGK